jgi:transketolase
MTASTPDTTLMANAIRALAMDAVQAANSGHPGAPMGMAEAAVALWSRHLKHNPSNPQWADRDRFVLSNGHGSMLIYALLHLTGYALPIEEIKAFRQLHSKTPGHPEVGVTPGIETTTGPLGQGITNAVGLALAEKLLARDFNRDGHEVVNHHTFCFLGDGCLMEGISHEAASLAAAWKLNKLIAVYDDNGISIDGQVAPWFGDNTAQRFAAYGWNVIGPVDGHDVAAVAAAIAQAKGSTDKPTLVIAKTSIGKGSPNRANTAKAHGEPLGADEIKLTRAAIGWAHEPFVIPAEVYAAWDAKASGAAAEAAWDERFEAYATAHPELAAEFQRRMAGVLPENFAQIAVEAVAKAHADAATVASRKASQIALEAFTAKLPEMIGGSADLTGSNLTNTSSTPNLRFEADGQPNNGRHINYGVREFGMAAIMNGLALHGGFIPYGGTFLTFSDYSRNAIRMAALMKQRVIHVMTHDSIGLGEDGPTHQSVEHVASLRLIPGLDVWRPADTEETVVAWTMALAQAAGPVAPEPGLHRQDPCRRDRQGRLCALRAQEGQGQGRDRRHRLRGAAGPGRPGPAGRGRRAGARGVDALHPGLRPPGFGLQAVGAAPEAAARGGRGRCDRLLVEVRLRRRRRHRHFRRVGPGAGAVQALRLHGRERRCHGEGGDQAQLSCNAVEPRGVKAWPRIPSRLAKNSFLWRLT